MVSADIGKDATQCSQFQRAMAGNRFLMRPVPLGSNPDMRPRLPDDLIVEDFECADKFRGIEIAWQPVRRQKV